MPVDYIDPDQVSDDYPPTGRQWFKIAESALVALGRDKPESRRDATRLINDLQQGGALYDLARHPLLWSQSN